MSVALVYAAAYKFSLSQQGLLIRNLGFIDVQNFKEWLKFKTFFFN